MYNVLCRKYFIINSSDSQRTETQSDITFQKFTYLFGNLQKGDYFGEKGIAGSKRSALYRFRQSSVPSDKVF